MNNLCLAGIGFDISCNAVVETHTYGNKHIAFVCLDVRSKISMHPQHTFIQRMVGWNSRETKQSSSARNIRLFKESLKLCLGITQFHTLTNQHQWFLRCIDKVGRMLKFYTVGIRYRVVATDKVEVHRFIIHHFCLCILGKIQNDRARTTTFSNIESTSYSPSHIFSTTNLVAPFADRLGNTNQIDFLKCIRTEHGSRCLSGNDYNGRTINHSIGYACNGIGCTRTACNQAYPNLARHTCKALCRMSRTLFVTHQNMIQRITMSV